MTMIDEFRTTRRDFIKYATSAGAGIALLQAELHATQPATNSANAATVIPEKTEFVYMVNLPYASNALQPSLSERTVNIHYYNHHRSYFDRLKAYIASNPEYDKIPLEKLIRETKGGILLDETIFNVAVLLENHNLYWLSMKPKGGIVSEKQSVLTKKIIDQYGSVESFKQKFIAECMTVGIGWVFLVKNNSGIALMHTVYHNKPLSSDVKLLLAIDMWEHAYYNDYTDNKQQYVENYLNNLINWEFAESLLK